MSIRRWAIVPLLCLLSVASLAGVLKEKGIAHIPYGGWSGVDAKVRATALRKAEINALDRYIANTNGAEERNYSALRPRIINHLSRFILSTETVTSLRDKKTHTYTLVISASLNKYAIGDALQANSAVANTSRAQRAYITFIFVARQQSSVTSFGANRTARMSVNRRLRASATSSAAVHSQSYSSTNHHVNGIDMAAQTQTQQGYASSHHSDRASHAASQSGRHDAYSSAVHVTATIHGSSEVTRRANVTLYRVRRSGTINDVVSNILSQAGYQVVDAKFIAARTHNLLNVSAFENEFGRGNDISQTTLANAAQAAQQVHVPYLAYGTLDVGLQSVDPATGLKRVYVEVTAKVYNLSGLFPITVAAIGPVQYAGLGPNAAVARTNALRLAARKAAQKLVSEMDAKGVT